MTDIVNELRQGSLNKDDYRWKAADEIERLRAQVRKSALDCLAADGQAADLMGEVSKLRAALRRIDRMEVYEADAHVVLWGKIGIMRGIARAALEDRT